MKQPSPRRLAQQAKITYENNNLMRKLISSRRNCPACETTHDHWRAFCSVCTAHMTPNDYSQTGDNYAKPIYKAI